MRIVAILASYNERRFIRACLQHYLEQGIEVYLLDNESTDGTVELAREFLGSNLIRIETFRRRGMLQWKRILLRKEEIADEIKCDWLLHADPDEIRVAPTSDMTLAEALEHVGREGYNAVNFMEYTFLPTKESPDHDHPDFQKTMRWYYPFGPRHPHRLNAWKTQGRPAPGVRAIARELIHHGRFGVPSVDLHSTGGHVVGFPGLKRFPVDFKLKHYIVLSLNHAIEKYTKKKFDPREIDSAHGWRATSSEEDFVFPSEREMRFYLDDDGLYPNEPRSEHLLVRRP